MAQWIFRLRSCFGSKVYSEVPDGGWGWIVAVALFLVEVFTYGVIKSFGIFLKDLMSDFNETNSRVSWIISICVFVMTFTAPLSTMLSNRFGFQPVVMFGGFLISLGTISTAFTSSINQMYLTIGIATGLGYCLTFLPTATILSQYFSRRRSVVMAMASTGESFATFAFAPAFTALKNYIGRRYTLVVIGTLQGITIICGALLRPIVIKPTSLTETEQKITYTLPVEQVQGFGSSGDSVVQSLEQEQGLKSGIELEEVEPVQINLKQQDNTSKNRLLDLTVLKEGSFLCYSAFGLFATLGFFAPQLYVVELSASLGTERDKAAYMLSIMAISEIIGRLSIGWVMNCGCIRKIFVLLICVSLMCLVLVLFTIVNGFWGLVVCCVLYGFLLGNITSTHIPMLAEDDVVGIQRMPLAVGVYVCIQSFAGLAGPPLGGVLVDITQNYSAAFYSCAAGMGLGAIFLGLVRPAKTGHLCRRRNNGENNSAVEQVSKASQRNC
ncbi:solute carrier family 16 member 6a [Danio rerio]|uniref:Monocarboxylate transporter 7 n=1 Tax=Danio rerio TaxID=7955 RepID=H6WYF6_DANRE|nr:solute carrier family 16 member 6a [Danio rerio]AFA55972.1 solute carrier family 16 member 6a [Danio rerio]|eukprot:NP_001243761.1 solute carrier family 16 member 6a [Danio rerio]